MTRAERVEWCKVRAREYLERGDVVNAVTSMLSDMKQSPETKDDVGDVITHMGMIIAGSGDVRDARRFVEGFN